MVTMRFGDVMYFFLSLAMQCGNDSGFVFWSCEEEQWRIVAVAM